MGGEVDNAKIFEKVINYGIGIPMIPSSSEDYLSIYNPSKKLRSEQSSVEQMIYNLQFLRLKRRVLE